jgi:hypothetical protein
MSFTTSVQTDPSQVGSGEVFGKSFDILTATTFENGLVQGRFAKLDAGSIDNVDLSATPVIAGVVKRSSVNKLESGAVIDSALYDQVEYVRNGYVTVDVVAADTPAQFGPVYVENLTTADLGKATTATTAGNVLMDAVFIEEVSTDVWLIRIK